MLSLKSLGAAGTVTGSKHLLTHEGHHVPIDCGLFQGLKNLRELNWEKLPVQPETIDAVILTHAHLDHSGYLPRLIRDGFRGRIYAPVALSNISRPYRSTRPFRCPMAWRCVSAMPAISWAPRMP